MDFASAVKTFWSNYTNFKGRARRSEYWFIQLFLVLTNLTAAAIDFVLINDVERFIANGGGGILGLIWILVTVVPALASLVRRLHDTSRSGWWALIGLVPFVGAIVLLVFTIGDSSARENNYGSSPKAATPAV